MHRHPFSPHEKKWYQPPCASQQKPSANAPHSSWQDIFIILTSSCARLLPRRQGYNQLPTHTARNRNSRAEDENRLIDQLDEEWDD